MLVTDKRLKIAGNSLIGVFARCTEKIVLLPLEAAEQDRLTLEGALKAEAVKMQIGGASVLGSLIAANSSGFVLTHHAGNRDLEFLRHYGRASRLPALEPSRVLAVISRCLAEVASSRGPTAISSMP